MPMTTGSDTRMYSPRSESNLGYSKDDGGYDHGIGDPETMEQLRDQKMKEKEQATSADDLPHLQLSIPKPEPQMPPMMPEEEEEPPMMDDQFNEGQQFGAMTGMPDMGNLSIGNATGTMPAPGGMLATGEPMEDAWSTLMKSRLDDAGKARPKNWRQSQFETQPGGARIETATSRRAKQQSRAMGGHKKRGLDEAPLSVHRTHLGIDTKQPLRMFPQKYGHQMATQARRKLMGNVPQIPAGHGLGPETSYQPKTPKMASGKGLKLTEPKVPREMGRSFGKSIDLIKEDIEDLQKMRDYLHLSQLRRLLRQLKETAERQERRLKAAVSGGPGNNREAGHREGQDSTTKPEGGTENLEDDPKNWGAPSTMFVARGSGRVG